MHLFTTVFGGSYGGKWILFFDGSGSRGGGRSGGWLIGGGGFWSSAAPSNVGLAIAVTAMAGLALAATVVYSRRGSLKSPWSRRRRRHALSPKQWKSLFETDGKVCDGVKFLKRVRSGGVDPTIRAEVWPFLLGVYDLNSSKEERHSIKKQNRKQYEVLRKQCRQITRRTEKSQGSKELSGYSSELSGDISRTSQECVGYSSECSGDISQVLDPVLEEAANATGPIFNGREDSADSNGSLSNVNSMEDLANLSKDPACLSSSPSNDSKEIGQSSNSAEVEEEEEEEDDSSESTLSDSSESGDLEYLQLQPFLSSGELDGTDTDGNPSSSEPDFVKKPHSDEDFATWQRIIRLDAVRANIEFQSQKQTNITSLKARRYAQSVGLKDFDHLESSMVFHAARLVAILEAYALYDPEIGYCQGMSDLLSPILSVVEDDDEAFWCFVGFMKKARHNFRLDEVGIRRQLSIVAKIIRCKDSHLYSHLEMLQAEDCFFVYRMVVVLFRRELSFEQTLCLWEVIWADQAALRAGITKSAWGRIRPRAPPTEDLLLYAIAASVLQRRKLIIEKYSSMEEIMRECNSMAGQLDVWRLLDDAHDLVVTLHHKM